MNGKYILLFVLFLNIMTLLVGLQFYEAGNDQIPQQNFVVALFIPSGQLAYENLTTTQTVQLTDSFTGAVDNSTAAQGGSLTSGTGFSFLDGIRMTLGFIVLITPLPIFAFIFSSGVPLIFAIFFFVPVLILYTIAIIGLIRGKDF